MQLQPQELVVPALGEEREASRCFLAAETIRRFGQLQFRAHGTSMLPAIWPGDVLQIERVPLEQPAVGQIWLALRSGRLVAHRVVRVQSVDGDFVVWLRGDFLDADDPETLASDLLGRVTAVVRYRQTRTAEVQTTTVCWWGRVLREYHALRAIALRVHGWREKRTRMLPVCAQVPIETRAQI